MLVSLIAHAICPMYSLSQETIWHLQTVPNAWRSVPTGNLAPVKGYSWYRALVNVPASWEGDQLTIFAEALDDARATTINGQTIGATGTFPPRFRSGLGEPGRYAVEEPAVKFGQTNTIAIRVYQSDPRPNFSVAPPVLLNETDMEAIRLEGSWQYRPGDDSSWSRATIADFGIDPNVKLSDAEAAAKGLYLRIDKVDDIERYVTRREGDTDPLSPIEAEKRFKTAEDLHVQFV